MHSADPVERVDISAFRIPTDAPEQDGTLDWQSTTLVTVALRAGARTGLGYTYAPAAAGPLIAELLVPVLRSSDSRAPAVMHDSMLAAVRNAGAPGLCALAISAVDTALWDLEARALELPLTVLLGAARSTVPIYGSGGFTSYDDERLRQQLGRWTEEGISRVKMKIGRDAEHDLHRVAIAREAIGPDTALFVDANGAYSAQTALRMAHELRARSDIVWFEEPRPSSDIAGLAWLRDRGPAGLDIAAGEYVYTLADARNLLEARAIDVLQLDVTRCGGITGFLRAATVARAFGVEISAHCAPSLHAHLGCVLPHLRHIE